MNPASGANTGYLNLSIGGSVTGNAGPVEVYRYRAFMLTLGATASVNAWYYPPLQNLPGDLDQLHRRGQPPRHRRRDPPPHRPAAGP